MGHGCIFAKPIDLVRADVLLSVLVVFEREVAGVCLSHNDHNFCMVTAASASAGLKVSDMVFNLMEVHAGDPQAGTRGLALKLAKHAFVEQLGRPDELFQAHSQGEVKHLRLEDYAVFLIDGFVRGVNSYRITKPVEGRVSRVVLKRLDYDDIDLATVYTKEPIPGWSHDVDARRYLGMDAVAVDRLAFEYDGDGDDPAGGGAGSASAKKKSTSDDRPPVSQACLC